MNLFQQTLDKEKSMFMIVVMTSFMENYHKKTFINLNIPGLKRGDTLVVECAHLREAHRFYSCSTFYYNQLEELKKLQMEGISILIFPQKSTPKARKLAGVDADELS